jgi:UDP-N-acetylglucosamine--N-acetylmuramyl-(pentapeptide) pyrophosphoryl-undecaprenol N-acetylglucosamine transferase
LKVLVIGGSQGAHYLNTTVCQALKTLLNDQMIQVWHQSGVKDEACVKELYGDLSENVRVTPFLDPIHQAYAWADLIISRSGALSVSEIASQGKPSILVPFPGAVGDHQRYNAEFLVQVGGAIMLSQDKASVQDWIQIIQGLIRNPARLIEMGQCALTLSHIDATEKVAAMCEKYV